MKKLILFACFFGWVNLSLAQVSPVEYKREERNDSLVLKVKNLLPAPMQYSLSCDTIDYSIDMLLPPNSDFIEVLVMPDLRESDTAKIGQFLEVSARLGDPAAKHDDNYRYQLPYERGKKYEVMQGPKGSFSHREDNSRYAVDFTMSEGEPIHAARSGVVCYVVEHYTEGGRDREKYYGKGNRVLILHDDGTLASYDHLKVDGAVVEIGDQVKQGELIGYSGSTGFSSKPHLHFVVLAGNKSVPFQFKGIKKIKQYKVYQAR